MKQIILILVFSISFLASCAPAQEILIPPPPLYPSVDPDTWAIVPAGEFLMGLHEHETIVDYNYEIMVTDVTKAQ